MNKFVTKDCDFSADNEEWAVALGKTLIFFNFSVICIASCSCGISILYIILPSDRYLAVECFR